VGIVHSTGSIVGSKQHNRTLDSRHIVRWRELRIAAADTAAAAAAAAADIAAAAVVAVGRSNLPVVDCCSHLDIAVDDPDILQEEVAAEILEQDQEGEAADHTVVQGNSDRIAGEEGRWEAGVPVLCGSSLARWHIPSLRCLQAPGQAFVRLPRPFHLEPERINAILRLCTARYLVFRSLDPEVERVSLSLTQCT
jgi:hypothetical protein